MARVTSAAPCPAAWDPGLGSPLRVAASRSRESQGRSQEGLGGTGWREFCGGTKNPEKIETQPQAPSRLLPPSLHTGPHTHPSGCPGLWAVSCLPAKCRPRALPGVSLPPQSAHLGKEGLLIFPISQMTVVRCSEDQWTSPDQDSLKLGSSSGSSASMSPAPGPPQTGLEGKRGGQGAPWGWGTWRQQLCCRIPFSPRNRV